MKISKKFQFFEKILTKIRKSENLGKFENWEKLKISKKIRFFEKKIAKIRKKSRFSEKNGRNRPLNRSEKVFKFEISQKFFLNFFPKKYFSATNREEKIKNSICVKFSDFLDCCLYRACRNQPQKGLTHS